MGDIVLSPEAIKKWGVRQWTAIGIGLSAGVCIAAYDIYLLVSINRFQWYIIIFVGIIVGFLITAWLLSRHYRVHVHHYCLGLLILFFPVRESVFSTVMQGLFYGVCLEGFSRWGPDPIFIPKETVAVKALLDSAPAAAQPAPAPAPIKTDIAQAAVLSSPTGDVAQTPLSPESVVISPVLSTPPAVAQWA